MAGISSHPVLRQAPSRSAFFCFFCLFVLPFLLRSSVYSPFPSVRSFVSSPFFCLFSLSVCPFFCSWFFRLSVLPFLLRSSVYSPFSSVRSSVLGSSVCPFFRFFSVLLSVFGDAFSATQDFCVKLLRRGSKTRYCQIFCHDARLFAKTLASWKNIKN